MIECSQKVRSVCPYGETCGGGEYKEGSDCDKFAESLQNKKAHKPGVGLITREQVEKMRGEWKTGSDTLGALIYCSECGRGLYVADRHKYQRCIHQQFCELCGAPMTDKAVDILWKRLEAMQDEAETV